ncbi:MAG: glycosyltransferase family 2 protein [Candidatus Omnitrophota bacterium]
MSNNLKVSVSVVIVTSGSKDYLWHCIDSIKAQNYPEIEVIVIDNSLDPNFPAKIRQSFPFISLYSNPQNLYYGVSLNKGIEISHSEFILCLNDDVVLDPDFIRQALKGFLLNDNIGMVSGKILRMDGLTLDSTGLFLSIWYSAEERGYGQIDTGKFEKSGFIFGVSGAAAFYRRKMLEDIKEGRYYFDPAFRMFYEDLDLSWRADNRGWKAYYIPGAKAFHVRGGSFRPDSGLGKPVARKYLNDELHSDLIKNRYLTILKNATFAGFFMHLGAIIPYDLCAWSYVFFFRPKVVKVFLRNLRSFPKIRFLGRFSR